ncbi:hypothetical protein K438DRAFT_1774120 [Mycena galopus ATCC 62051]|nr:hypothetical protein K438DRAFT_1774120 [Mycena galopus ATCC 62051]
MSFNSNSILGALLVGTWANSVLYTIEIFQLLVSSAITVDSVSMIANYASVYLSLTEFVFLRRFGVSPEPVLGKSFRSNSKKHTRTHVIEQPYPLYVFTTGIVAALAQSFLTVRYWLLTKSRFITLTLFLFITTAIGGAFATAITLVISPGYKDREKAVVPGTIFFVAEAVTDVSIALALLWQLMKVKSLSKQTMSLLNRLVAQTIQTGTAGATIALAALVAFLASKESNISVGIAYCLGRVYCITLVRTLMKKFLRVGVSQNLKLANLNFRNTQKPWSSKAPSSCANPETRGERENQEQSEGGDDYGGIRGFLLRALMRLRLTQCVFQISTVWYCDF